MKDILVKLAEIATQLDEAGHKEQADKLDMVMMQLASELNSVATPLTGGGHLTQEELNRLQDIDTTPAPAEQAQLPQTSSDKIVMRSKTSEAQGYGFFTTTDIENAVKEGRVDTAEAIRAIQHYLKAVGFNMPVDTLPELIQVLLRYEYLPQTGRAPEVYGASKKNIWQRIFGK